MDWLKTNGWIFSIIAIGLVLVVFVICLMIFFKTRKLSNSIVDSSLKMTASLMYDSDDGNEVLNINIFNTSFKDVSIGDFGIDYRNQRLNFLAEYIESKKLNSLPIIQARTSINFRFNPQKLEKFILSHNYKETKISTIYMVVTDSVGNEFVKKNRALSKVLRQRQEQRLKLARIIVHDKKVAEYRQSHDDRDPMSHSIWKVFHHQSSKMDISELIDELSDRQKFDITKTKQIPDFQSASANTKTSYDASNSTTISSSSGEIKMTYLSEGKPKTRKKKVKEDVSSVKEEDK